MVCFPFVENLKHSEGLGYKMTQVTEPCIEILELKIPYHQLFKECQVSLPMYPIFSWLSALTVYCQEEVDVVFTYTYK